jgi:uncharacterized 2Fe-2S/4Fe-4S cluster protein (DUF4445 family)
MEVYQKLNIQLNKQAVLQRLQGDKSKQLSQELGSVYERLLPEFLQWIQPECRIEVERQEKKAYILMTLGSKITEKTEFKMQEGNVMEALMLDAMADTYLFQMDGELQALTKELFAEIKLGVEKRLDPGVDLELKEQRSIYDKVKKDADDIRITKGYMFNPVKTFGYILQLTENREIFRMQHDCSKCNNLQCKMRGKVQLEMRAAESFSVITAGTTISHEVGNQMQPHFQIAVDLGTTTIAMQLLAGEKAVPVKTYTAVNSCRKYGSDVITRIQNANSGGLEILQRLSRADLLQGVKSLCKAAQITLADIERIGIAGNTTVSQILLGQSLQGLAAYPFTPVTYKLQKLTFGEVFENSESQAEVIVLPPISGFVGGDIVAGVFQCGFLNRKRPAMLIDIGTNGEMVIGDGEHLLCTSVAAGPAFEGGGLRNGVGSIAGAISAFEFPGKITTIQEKSPVGICGTGMVEILSELKDARILNKEGNLSEQYVSNGYQVAKSESGQAISVYQQDIRELQLAKGAIGAGIEMLAKAYGKTYREIPEVFVAGGFGYRMNIRKAVNIGIFPREFLGKIKTVGNTSLAGVESFLRDSEAEEKLQKITEISQEVILAKTEEFEKTYVKHLDL